jgi:hypothetical protein
LYSKGFVVGFENRNDVILCITTFVCLCTHLFLFHTVLKILCVVMMSALLWTYVGQHVASIWAYIIVL